jgi:CTP synthase (UTP-ammonia lyase)
MPHPTRIALVGDHDPAVTAHAAIPLALARAAEGLGAPLEWAWVGTDEVDPARPAERLAGFHGVWCVPASPYRSFEGALAAIRHAREGGVPFLGTCGGFQHAVIEFARGVLGHAGADHAESNPQAEMALVAPLSCSLVGARGRVHLRDGGRARERYGAASAEEAYHCSYGLNPAHAPLLAGSALRVTGVDDGGEVRIVELEGHPFFVATLFQPERAALAGAAHPLVDAFAAAAARHAARVERVGG